MNDASRAATPAGRLGGAMCRGGVPALSALAMALVLLWSADANAAPGRLDCAMAKLETKTGSNFDVEAENRSIIVVFDEDAKTLSVYQDGGKQPLAHVTITPIAMSGYVDDLSLGIDRSSWDVVLQTYKPGSKSTEFGACSLSAKPLP
jgi:hypothetical protein